MTSGTLHITNNTIKYGDRVYAVRNITQIDVLQLKRKPKVSGSTLAICAGLEFICLYYPVVPARLYSSIVGAPLPPDWFGMVVLLLFVQFIYGVWDRMRLDYYSLVIETSAGSATLFASRNNQLIVEVAEKIRQAMDDPASVLSYHINIGGDVITVSGDRNKVVSRTTMGTFSNDD